MILLCAINATYQYPSLGLRCLLANLGELRDQTELLEFSIKRDPHEVAAELMLRQPRVVGFGVYIWNVEHVVKVCRLIKSRCPDIHIVVGGPEVSYEWESSPLRNFVDAVVQGEGEQAFRDHCREVLSGAWQPAEVATVIKGQVLDLTEQQFPYQFYSDHDLKTRHVCVEASRGCPFKCQFCLSSLDTQVRRFPLDAFCGEMQRLLERGARNFKFIDRTFNLSATTCERILRLFLPWKDEGLFLHFEMVPDRLPEVVKLMVGQFPRGSIQFEVGIQTLNQVVARRIERFNDWDSVQANMKFLVHHSPVHIHADLIAGLPGEGIHSFAEGFDQLLALGPHEIQVGILKRLKGAPIVRHELDWGLVFVSEPPYQVVQTKNLSLEELQWIQRFAKFWDRIYNSGCFHEFLHLLWADRQSDRSKFWRFMDLVRFLHGLHSSTYRLHQMDLIQALLRYLIEVLRVDPSDARAALARDYKDNIDESVPQFLRRM